VTEDIVFQQNFANFISISIYLNGFKLAKPKFKSLKLPTIFYIKRIYHDLILFDFKAVVSINKKRIRLNLLKSSGIYELRNPTLSD